MKAQLTPEAELDLIEAIRWYDERDQNLGDDLLRHVYRCIASIESNPQLYSIVHGQNETSFVAPLSFSGFVRDRG